MRLLKGIAGGLGLALIVPLTAHAVTQTFNLTTRITITSACSITTTPINFGTISTATGAEIANGSAKVSCSLGTPYAVSFGSGFVFTSGTGTLTGPAGNTMTFTATILTPAGTTSGTHVLKGQLAAKAYPVAGLYQQNFLIYVNY